ncbi:hypothetical protein V6N12_062868 [Hibiscus sabdariffa]|uniref:Uncharacterized protein n=1 Tax=Hibiscus sabdariffa TaxID=183260 RepID=A0ABR2FA20_9ROSI
MGSDDVEIKCSPVLGIWEDSSSIDQCFAPNTEEKQVALWDVLAEYKEHVLKFWAAGGDFNVVGCKSERRQIAELEKNIVESVSRHVDRLMVAEVEIDLDKGRCFIHSCFC